MVKTFKSSTSQKAWEDVNEYLLLAEKELKNYNQGRDGNASIMYDVHIEISKAWVDPEFDFGRMFGYRVQKWSHLVNNYVDLNYLDILKQEIQTREAKKQRIYQVTKHFSNIHGNGKDCLISLTFCRRMNSDVPVLVFHTRATEVTKRLLIDFLLIQRMGEYIYGKDKTFSIVAYFPMAYLSIEAFTMYHTHKSIKKLLRPLHNPTKKQSELGPFQKKVLETLDKFLTIDPMKISYKSHRRAVKQLQTDKNGHPLSGNRPMKVKDMQLLNFKVKYPPDCISEKQRAKYRQELRNKNVIKG